MTKSPHQVAEDYLESQYLNKFVKYSPVGRDELYGKIDRITVDNTRTPHMVIFVMDNNLKYEEELDEFPNLITLL